MKKEAGKAEAFFKKEGKREELSRIRDLMESIRDELEEFSVPLSAEGLIDYFTEKKESFLDCFPTEKTLLFLDEPTGFWNRPRRLSWNSGKVWNTGWKRGMSCRDRRSCCFSSQEAAARMCAGRAVGLCTLENARSPWMVTESTVLRSVL